MPYENSKNAGIFGRAKAGMGYRKIKSGGSQNRR